MFVFSSSISLYLRSTISSFFSFYILSISSNTTLNWSSFPSISIYIPFCDSFKSLISYSYFNYCISKNFYCFSNSVSSSLTFYLAISPVILTLFSNSVLSLWYFLYSLLSLVIKSTNLLSFNKAFLAKSVAWPTYSYISF